MNAPLNPALLEPGPRHMGSRPGADLPRFLHEVRTGITPWVRTLLAQAAEGLESSQQGLAVAGDRQHTMPAIGWLRGQSPALAEQITLHLTQALDRQAQGLPDTAALPGTASGATTGLRLIDEAQIDEDIEIGRLVQAIESTADLELQQLAALCGGLRGLAFVDIRAVPLPPLACARALRAGVAALASDAGTRGLLLRHLGHATGVQMKAVYTAQADLLTRWGVAPAPFRLKLTAGQDRPAAAPHATAPGNARAQPGRPDSPDSPTRPPPHADTDWPPLATGADRHALMASLQRLVAHARDQEAEAPAPQAPPYPELPDPEGPLLRLVDEPRPLGSAGPHPSARSSTPAPLGHEAAVRLMERLFGHLESQLVMSDHSRALLSGLRKPGRALAASEPQLWQNMDHPWWTLLDRLIALGTAHADDETAAADPVSEALGQVVLRMGQTTTADRQAWQAASDDVQAAAERQVSTCLDALEPEVGPLQTQADRDEIETELRNQIVQQLRSTPVCTGLRQFLVGPWAHTLALTAQRHGAQSAELAQQALVVDDLIQATQQPGRRVSSAQRAVLLRQAREGLVESGLLPTRIEAELADLHTLLRNPPPAQEEDWHEPLPSMPMPWALDLHAALPTVPLEMGHDTPGNATPAGPTHWTDSLEPGVHCRLFLLGRWMTVQLAWVNETRSLFLFNSRHGGRVHSLTRRMLHKLREAGLATSIEDGYLLAQAMDSMLHSQAAAG